MNQSNDKSKPANPWLPPGYVIAVIWVVIFGILGYVHYCLTVPPTSAGYSSSYSPYSSYGGYGYNSSGYDYGSNGYGSNRYGSNGYGSNYTPSNRSNFGNVTPSDASVAGRFIVATVAFCLSYPLITGLQVSNVEKIMNVLTLCVAFVATGFVYSEQKALTYFMVPFVLWAVYVNVVTVAIKTSVPKVVA